MEQIRIEPEQPSFEDIRKQFSQIPRTSPSIESDRIRMLSKMLDAAGNNLDHLKAVQVLAQQYSMPGTPFLQIIDTRIKNVIDQN